MDTVPEPAAQSTRAIIKFFENLVFHEYYMYMNTELSTEMLCCECLERSLPHAKKTTLSLHIYRCVRKLFVCHI